MKILHTSDWHIGKMLHGRKRYEEFGLFLDWLAETIIREQIDVLIVAGDVFDTSSPSATAQELYYGFLARIAKSCCRHVIVTAGNHDSPSLLNAPKGILRALNVHVVGCATKNPEDEILLLKDGNGQPELIVCAVPYLRDRDIRTVDAGESVTDKERKLIEGIRSHYAAVCDLAEKLRREHNESIPIIATGHLFTAGGQTVDGDGVRELYIGSLAHVAADIFPECIDYLALGHLHVPQLVGGSVTRRYSGSPLPMGFGEAKQEKSVVIADFADGKSDIKTIQVPRFQPLESIRGNWNEIEARINELKNESSTAWLEIVYQGEEIIGNLRNRLDELIAGTRIEILRTQNTRIIDRVLNRIHEEETLDSLNVDEVFDRCLAAHEIPDEQKVILRDTYREAVMSLHNIDPLAE